MDTTRKERRSAGRPTRAQAAAIDGLVLDGARTAFCRLGIAGVAMDELATAIGVSKHTIYRRYPNKTALLAAVVERDLANIRAMASETGDDGDTLASLKITIRRFFDFGLATENMAFLAFLSAEASFSVEMQRKFTVWEQLAVSPITERIAAAQEAGRLRPGDPATLCDILTDLVDGAANRLRTGCRDVFACGVTPDRFFEERWAVFVRAMTPD